MKRTLVRTFSLLSPKLCCTNPLDKTCIDNTEPKIEIINIAIDRKTDGMAVASATLALLATSKFFDPQVPSSLLQLQHDDKRQRNISTNFPLRWHLQASFVNFQLLLKHAGSQKQGIYSCYVST